MKFTKEALQQEIVKCLKSEYGYAPEDATDRQVYGAVLTTVQRILVSKRGDYLDSLKKNDKKRIYYMSMEFLMGRSLRNNLYNLGITSEMEEALREICGQCVMLQSIDFQQFERSVLYS